MSYRFPINQVPTGSAEKFLREDDDWKSLVVESFPVGSVFIAVVSTNPATLLGYGTWSAFGAGRVMVGLDSGDTDFDTVEETGGSKTVAAAGTNSTPTFTGAALGTHSHSAGTLVPSAHAGTAVTNHSTLAHTHNAHTTELVGLSVGGDTTVLTGPATHSSQLGVLTHSVTQPSAHTMSGSSSADSAGTPAGTVSAPTFTGSATSVVQSYIVVYMYKRTS